MKKLIILFILLPALCWGMNPYIAGSVRSSGGNITLLFHETFESTGYDNTGWTAGSATPNPDKDTAGLSMAGSYCLELYDAADDERAYSPSITNSGETWVAVMVRTTDGQPTTANYILDLRDSSGAQIFTIRIGTDGRLRCTPVSGTAGYINDTGGSTVYLTDGVNNFYLKIRYKPSTAGNSDGEIEIWYSTGGTWGNSGYSIADCGDEYNLQSVRLQNYNYNAETIYFDEVKIDDENIGNY